jgi:hypothetical protein
MPPELLDPPKPPPELLDPPKPPPELELDPPKPPPELELDPPKPPPELEPVFPVPPSKPGFEVLLEHATKALTKQPALATRQSDALRNFANILISSDDDEQIP